MICHLTVTINHHINSANNKFTEILYKWYGGNALTRLWYVIPNTSHQIEIEKQAFINRMRRNGYEFA